MASSPWADTHLIISIPKGFEALAHAVLGEGLIGNHVAVTIHEPTHMTGFGVITSTDKDGLTLTTADNEDRRFGWWEIRSVRIPK